MIYGHRAFVVSAGLVNGHGVLSLECFNTPAFRMPCLLQFEVFLRTRLVCMDFVSSQIFSQLLAAVIKIGFKLPFFCLLDDSKSYALLKPWFMAYVFDLTYQEWQFDLSCRQSDRQMR
jgi:hypothetical protein